MKAIDLFEKSKKPNEILYTLFFRACTHVCSSQSLNLIKSRLNDLPLLFYKNEYLLTSLIEALMTCGDVEKAESIFHSTPNHHIHMIGAMMKGDILYCSIDIN